MKLDHKLRMLMWAAAIWGLPLIGLGCALHSHPNIEAGSAQASARPVETASAMRESPPVSSPDADPKAEAPLAMAEEDLLQEPDAPLAPAAAPAPGQDLTAMAGVSEAPGSMARPGADPATDRLAGRAVETVAVDPDDLRLRVAFAGFQTALPGAEKEAADFFRERLIALLEAACSKRIVLLFPGDPAFPESLNQLPRDQFGNFNSFELTTLARASGLNAVITGRLIDVRLFNEISGVLWYKSPEGSLRVAIHAALYDAETGTKLLDKNYVFKDRVEELAPGAAPTVRKEDRAALQQGLTTIAADMHEDVCERLDDQPWRAFVLGSEGDRVTLSAGSFSGLVPGNALTVHNSQIVDGLNNQQFFLTGERLGRIQIVRVDPDRSEAILVEGLKPNLYGVAIPE